MTTLLKNARRLRAEMTDAERCLWQALRLRQVGARFRRQAPVGPYIADFICFNPRMVIEVDGGQHAEETTKDEDRDAWFAKGGFVVLRFWNNEVLGNIDGVMEQITDALARSAPHPSPPPRGGREPDSWIVPRTGQLRPLGEGQGGGSERTAPLESSGRHRAEVGQIRGVVAGSPPPQPSPARGEGA